MITAQLKTSFVFTNATSIAISGNNLVLAIGVASYNTNGGIYIYDWISNNWALRNIITSSYTPEYLYGGSQVGDYIDINYDGSRVITNIRHKITGYGYEDYNAMCLIFTWNNNTWQESSFIYNQNLDYGIVKSLEISNDNSKIIVSCLLSIPLDEGNSGTYIYEYNNINNQYVYNNFLKINSNTPVIDIAYNELESSYWYMTSNQGRQSIYKKNGDYVLGYYSLRKLSISQYVGIITGNVSIYEDLNNVVITSPSISIPIGAKIIDITNNRIVFADYSNNIYDYEIVASEPPVDPPESEFVESYYINGYVKENISELLPVGGRYVRAYSRATGNLLGEAISNSEGYYKIENLPQSYDLIYLICLDDEQETIYNSLIKDRITPKMELKEI